MIRGEKVILRAVDVSDAPRLAAWLNDEEVTRFLPDSAPTTVAAEEAWLRSDPGPETRFSVDTFKGRHIGYCALRAGRPAERSAMLSLLIGDNEYRGEGYGIDTTITLATFGFAHQNLHRIWLHVIAEHEAGILCYERAGFHHEGRLRDHCYRHGRFWDMLAMGLLRGEFQTKHPERWPSDEE